VVTELEQVSPVGSDEWLAGEYTEMIKADAGHLAEALRRGDRTLAHGFVDSIINRSRDLEDLLAKR
jgi:hypothetical protein